MATNHCHRVDTDIMTNIFILSNHNCTVWIIIMTNIMFMMANHICTVGTNISDHSAFMLFVQVSLFGKVVVMVFIF